MAIYPDGHFLDEVLFYTSRIEVFFSLKGVARQQGRALERHECSWEG
jgi:hypothetical protein